MLKTGMNYMSISYRFMITAFCCCMLFGAKGYLMDTDSLRLEEQNGRFFVIHEVEANETLYSLSRRYSTEIDSITNNNELRNGGIDLGQILMIPVAAPKVDDQVDGEPDLPIDTGRMTHVVAKGETVYSLSKRYDIQFSELRNWNELSDNNLSIGMILYVSPPIAVVQSEPEEVISMDDEVPRPVPEEEVNEGDPDPEDEVEVGEEPVNYYTHYVQSGETLTQLARRFETIPDSLITWNELENTTLRIGDMLLVKKPIERDSLNHSIPQAQFTSYGSKYWKETSDQDTLIHEEGIAGTIENIIETRKFLALHRTLPVGAVMKVVNLMNHESLEVRVVGKLPNTGLNRNMMIRFTDATFKQLGIIDKKSRVEIIYSETRG